MIRPIGTIKREIRILGLDTCGGEEVLGAIVRGGSFLDGIVRFKPQERTEQKLAEDVLATKYYPELRALMLHDTNNVFRTSVLQALVGLPVIKVSSARKKSKNYSVFRSSRGTLFHQSDIASAVTARILALTWSMGTLPEPVRIAHLLSKRAKFRAV